MSSEPAGLDGLRVDGTQRSARGANYSRSDRGGSGACSRPSACFLRSPPDHITLRKVQFQALRASPVGGTARGRRATRVVESSSEDLER